MESFRILYRCQFQSGRFTNGTYCVAAYFLTGLVVADSFQFTGFKSHIVKSEQEIVFAFAFS